MRPKRFHRVALSVAGMLAIAASQLAFGLASASDSTAGSGGLVLTTADPAGTTLVGACFELWTEGGDGTKGRPREGHRSM